MIVFLELWAQLFKENLGTCRLAMKLEGTQFPTSFFNLFGRLFHILHSLFVLTGLF